MKTKVRISQTAVLGLLGLIILIVLAVPAGAEKALPRPQGYVSDFAHVVAPELKSRIEAICQELDQKTGAQIGVASFSDLGGDEIDGFTVRLFEQWQPGAQGINNGILIVDAIQERQIRIEIGYGLEGIIPDAVAGRIRRDVMTPFLAENQHGEAYLAGVATLAQIVAKEENVTLESLTGVNVAVPQGPSRRNKKSPIVWILPIIIIAIIASRRNRGGGIRGGGPFIGGPFIGGGFGGGSGFGGGGFGGFGGGMSGGGGSSGGY